MAEKEEKKRIQKQKEKDEDVLDTVDIEEANSSNIFDERVDNKHKTVYRSETGNQITGTLQKLEKTNAVALKHKRK